MLHHLYVPKRDPGMIRGTQIQTKEVTSLFSRKYDFCKTVARMYCTLLPHVTVFQPRYGLEISSEWEKVVFSSAAATSCGRHKRLSGLQRAPYRQQTSMHNSFQ